MTTHTELFNKLAGNYDFATLWQIEDEVHRDLHNSELDLESAELIFAFSSPKFRLYAYVNWTFAKIHCYEKTAAYNKFYN